MSRQLTGAEFARLFDTFKRSAERLEVHQHYDVPEEAEQFAAWQAGEDVRFEADEWTQRIARDTAAGKQWRRYRVIIPPASPYVRFELAALRPSIQAGEQVRVLPWKATAWPLIDSWVFDGQQIVRMDYDDRGRWFGAVLLDRSDHYDAARILADHAVALVRSVPLTSWIAGVSA